MNSHKIRKTTSLSDLKSFTVFTLIVLTIWTSVHLSTLLYFNISVFCHGCNSTEVYFNKNVFHHECVSQNVSHMYFNVCVSMCVSYLFHHKCISRYGATARARARFRHSGSYRLQPLLGHRFKHLEHHNSNDQHYQYHHHLLHFVVKSDFDTRNRIS